MCTVSWFFDAGGFELFFNRDELRSRGAATPPEIAVTDGTRYLAPTDLDAGGTWLAVNERGTALGLLNAHPAAAMARHGVVSRGLLVRRLASLEGAETLRSALAGVDLDRLLPFTLVALSPGGGQAVVDWDGRELATRAAGEPPLLSSSSVDARGAEAARRALLATELESAGDRRAAHLKFHCSHHPERGPLSPCMHRADARTVSFCHALVAPDAATMAYAAGPPCRSAAGPGGRLNRTSAASTRGEAAVRPSIRPDEGRGSRARARDGE
jgi:hypothetical protein